MSPFSDTSSPFLRLPPPLTRSIVLFFPKEKLQLALIEVHDDEVIHAPADINESLTTVEFYNGMFAQVGRG